MRKNPFEQPALRRTRNVHAVDFFCQTEPDRLTINLGNRGIALFLTIRLNGDSEPGFLDCTNKARHDEQPAIEASFRYPDV